jgi:hypothetical protein
MNSILKLFSDHGTFVLPDALTYIFSKDKPDDFAEFLIKNLREYPLFLALDTIKTIEDSTKQLTETPTTLGKDHRKRDTKKTSLKDVQQVRLYKRDW